MSAEHLIALEAAVAELGALYTVARTFTALAARAEGELLPGVSALGSRLRRLVRRAELSQRDIDAASAEVLAVRAEWRTALDAVHGSPAYQQALAAFSANRQEALVTLIPQVFAGHRQVRPETALYFPVSASTGRRRPGHSPFLGADECADHLVTVLAGGLAPEPGGDEWWERELPFLTAADDPDAFDTPLSVRLRAGDAAAAVFAVHDEPTLRIYTPRLQAPLAPVLATEAADEWWNAYEGSYGAFRDALRAALAARGVAVFVAASAAR